MKISTEVHVQPFRVPNFVLLEPEVRVDEATMGEGSLPLSSIDALDLDRLLREFRIAVFKKAGKSFPVTPAPLCSQCHKPIH